MFQPLVDFEIFPPIGDIYRGTTPSSECIWRVDVLPGTAWLDPVEPLYCAAELQGMCACPAELQGMSCEEIQSTSTKKYYPQCEGRQERNNQKKC